MSLSLRLIASLLIWILLIGHDSVFCTQDSGITPFAFRGSADRCKSYFILESGFLGRASSSGYYPDGAWLIPWDIGLMTNVSRKVAVGGSLHFGSTDDQTNVGLRSRVRLWIASRSGVDFTLGMLVSSNEGEDDRKLKSPGLIAGVSFAAQELISVELFYENYNSEHLTYIETEPYRETRTGSHSALYFGATGRSYLAFIMPLVIIIGTLATWGS